MAYSSITKPSLHFNTVTYTGNATARSITGVGFQPDWVWIKNRSSGSLWHQLQDAVRGAAKNLYSNNTNAEAATGTASITSFDSDGFTIGTGNGANGNGNNIVSWNWKAANSSGSSNSDGSITSTVSANTTAGFSIITYTGTGSTTTVGHGLGVKPNVVIYKERNSANSWRLMTDVSGTLKRLYLNVTDAEASITDSSTAPTSTVLNIGTGSEVNRDSNATYVAYCFAQKKGFSKFGLYTGQDGVFIYTGFKPAFILGKNISNAGYDWWIFDNKRDTFNDGANNLLLRANSADAEATFTYAKVDFLSNGFKIYGTDNTVNGNGATMFYMAFAEEPFVANVGSNGIPATAR